MLPTPPRITDLALARRLERAEASANAAFVDARLALQPAAGASWRDFNGTYAMFDGVGSPLTQTFGLGLFAAPDADGLASIEAFFTERGADVFHEVAPLANPAVMTLLPMRGYVPMEFTTVLHRSLVPESLSALKTPATITTRRIEADELGAWAEVSAQGWGESPELAAFMRDFGNITGRSRGVSCFLAELDGHMVGTGAMAMHGGVALLAGASTIPAFRGRGAQTALLEARLAYAADHGCDLAMMGAAPGSTSQTNAERQGFRIAYTRLKWHLPLGR
jgi:GNAT superfamily N-acetyltransferase